MTPRRHNWAQWADDLMILWLRRYLLARHPTGKRRRTDPGYVRPHPNSLKTHCVNGHPFSPENTYRADDGRRCIECRKASESRRGPRHRAIV